jgi:hypothetical protein
MYFYADEFLSAKPGSFEKKEFNVGTDKSLETEVFEALNSFGIKGTVVGSETGPYITRVYFKLDRGVRFNSIEPLTDDLKMSLGTSSIKIMPDPEQGAVAIEIPNAKREIIPFGNVFHADHSDMVLPAALGVDPKGNPVYLDIAEIPHVLIAGTTGSGKSVCLNSIIASLAQNCRPTDLQLLLIDPKGTEFVQYESLKNLISGKIIDDVETALKSLTWLVEEMECRYNIFKRCKCRSIDEYKHKRNFGLNDGVSTCFVEDMPHIVAVIDEYADLMMNSANALQENVKKLGQKARAAGIHLILATQRPSAKIVDGDIKVNMTTRIALKVSSIADSRTILDYSGAERLLGKGDILLKKQDKEEPQRVHGCFISDEEIKKAIELLPQKKLYRINEDDVFEHDIHDLHAQEDLKKHATWGELNAVSKIILENFSEFMDREYDTIYQVCARRLGMDKSRVDIVFSDVSGAIGDSDFYQVLQRSCSENDENCDYPFVKAVIYSSPLRWKYKDGRYLFTDYILEQAFEEDDPAAMASVQFFCNVETFHLDYLRKKFDKLYENGNEKAKEYLEGFKNKVVNELKNEYCDNIEGYPNRDLFDRLLAEAYPPLMNFLLESGNEQYFIDAAENNSLIVDFVTEQALIDKSWKDFAFEELNDFTEKCVQRMAERGDEKAIERICDWDDDYISDSVRETIFQLAVQDKDNAIKKVACYSREYELDKRLWELTERGQNKAIEYICQHIEHGDYGSCDTNLVFDFAKSGNERACKCIRGNYDAFEDYVIEFIDGQDFADVKDFAKKINLFQHIDCRVSTYAHFVCDMADEGNADAIELIYYNKKYRFFKEYIMNKADEADGDAWNCIRQHCYKDECYEFYDYVKSCAIEYEGVGALARELIFDHLYDFRDFVLKLACFGDESAKNAFYCALDSSKKNETFYCGYVLDCETNEGRKICEFILNDAQNGDGKSQNAIYKNPQIEIFPQYILDEAKLGDDDAVEVIYSHPNVDDFYDYILQQAKAGNCDAKKVVLENPEIAPFREYICKLASSNDEEAKAVVLANVKYELFRKCVVELVFHGDSGAKKVVLENPEIAPFQECICKLVSSNDENAKTVVLANVKYDLFKKCIVELAFQGDCGAKKVVLENPEIAPFQECICKLVSSNDEDAKTVVLANVKYDLFQKCIVELVLQGDCSAKKVVIENPEIALFQKHICEIATSDDEDAKKTILDNFEICLFQECICKMALSGDERAKNVVYANEKNASCRKFIVSEAYQNVERALKCIESNPQNKEYESFLIDKCFEQNEWALAIICDNSDYYGHWINKIIKSQYDKNNLKELLVEKILHLAKYDDNALKYVVCENPQEEKFKDLIAEKIKQNNDVVECMCRYYLQKISSDKRNYFGEFVRQRISKEFGLCFESDDVALKSSIGYLSYRNDSLYFVLAKAWGGNKLALDVFRRSFEFFGPAIIECLRDSDSQIWKYAMDCVKSESTGKIIKELAENGNGMANEIVLNFQLLCS